MALADEDTFDGRYLIIGELGSGGMGRVYKAKDRETKKECALKLLQPNLLESEDALASLKREVAIAIDLTHQNLLRINHLEIKNRLAYVVMEYLDGENLEEYRRKKGGRIESAELRRLMMPVLAGLGCLHDHGIVHLDIKPQNIMLLKSGEVKLMESRGPSEKKWPPANVIYRELFALWRPSS